MKRKLQQEYEIYLPRLDKKFSVSVDDNYDFKVVDEYEVEETIDASRYFATTMLWIAIVAAACDTIYQVTNWAISLH